MSVCLVARTSEDITTQTAASEDFLRPPHRENPLSSAQISVSSLVHLSAPATTPTRRPRSRKSERERDTISAAEAAAICNVTTKTLGRWRAKGIGPPFEQPNGGKIHYSRAEILKWKAERRVTHRDDAAPFSPGSRISTPR